MSRESERPVIYNLDEIEEATNYFDETGNIGSGGYGSVYFGTLGKTVCRPYLDSSMVPKLQVHSLNVLNPKNWRVFDCRRLL